MGLFDPTKRDPLESNYEEIINRISFTKDLEYFRTDLNMSYDITSLNKNDTQFISIDPYTKFEVDSIIAEVNTLIQPPDFEIDQSEFEKLLNAEETVDEN